MRRISVLSIAGTAVLATVTSACGVSVNTANGGSTSYTSGQQLLVNAADKLGQADSLKVDMHYDISQGLLDQIQSSGDSSTDVALGEKIIQSHIVVSESSNGPLANVTPGNPAAVDLSLVTDGSTLAEFRVIDGNLYARADFSAIASLTGQSLDNLQSQLGNAPSQVQQWAQAALNGDWLEISKQQLTALEGLAQNGMSSSPSALSPAQARQLVQSIESVSKGVFVKDVTVTDKGSTSKGEELALTADAHTSISDLVNGVLPIVERVDPMIKDNPGMSQLQQGLAQIPRKNVTADAYVSNGSLSEVSLDFMQFVPPADAAQVAGQHFTFISDFTPNSGAVTAPSGATQVDIAGLLSQFGSSMKL